MVILSGIQLYSHNTCTQPYSHTVNCIQPYTHHNSQQLVNCIQPHSHNTCNGDLIRYNLIISSDKILPLTHVSSQNKTLITSFLLFFFIFILGINFSISFWVKRFGKLIPHEILPLTAFSNNSINSYGGD